MSQFRYKMDAPAAAEMKALHDEMDKLHVRREIAQRKYTLAICNQSEDHAIAAMPGIRIADRTIQAQREKMRLRLAELMPKETEGDVDTIFDVDTSELVVWRYTDPRQDAAMAMAPPSPGCPDPETDPK